MKNKNDGGPAYPVRYKHQEKGMSLRDEFASSVIQGLCVGLNDNDDFGNNPDLMSKALSFIAYKIADAMISERDK